MTRAELMEKATNIALGQVLCNRDELMENHTAVDVFSRFDELDEARDLEVWEPFESDPLADIKEKVEGIRDSVVAEFEELTIPEPEIPCSCMSRGCL